MPVMKKAADTLTTTTTTTTPLMEIGSGSVTESGSSNTSTNNETATSQSIIGLKFGKKIYFEDHHRRHHHQRVGSSSSLSRSKKGRNQQPPRCQVEGCNVDLSDVKGYYSKHKVCISHSKSPTVVVAGLDQRFCQQCSRFHRLTEFDQGKRSCRRRLAGHNERRRKPQQASILSSRYARLASTVFDNSSQSGGFLLDFSAYARQTEKDAWRGTKPSQQAPGNQVTAAGGSITPFPWQDSSQNLSLYLQGSTGTSSSSIPPGECFTGVSLANANCALSLLSNTSWGSRTETSCLDINNLTNTEVASITQSTGPHGMAFNQYSDQHWSFKDDAAGFTSHELHPDLGLGQISQPLISQLSSEAELSQQNRRQYLLFDQSRDNDSATQSINWFL